MDYKKAGVNIKSGDKCSKIAYEASKKTFKFAGKFLTVPKMDGAFSGVVKINYKKPYLLVKNSDGIGSKSVLATQLGKLTNLGYDLMVTTVDDAAAVGALPLFATNTIDIGKTNPKIITKIFTGLVKACKEAKVAMVGGEIAELPDQMKTKESFTWNSDIVGLLDPKLSLAKKKPKNGEFIVGFKSNGIRSNGLTLARRILEKKYSKNFHKTKKGKKLGLLLLKKGKIYAPLVTELVGYTGKKPLISTAAHITGGGLPDNMARILKKQKLGADIIDPFTPHKEFLELQELGKVTDNEAYKVWNMGQGFVVTTFKPKAVIKTAKKHKITAKIIGKVNRAKKITIKSKGIYKKDLVFNY